jgi:ribulose-5-phosphate 4-epimerase/fuculose-1-phosphate aldolase
MIEMLATPPANRTYEAGERQLRIDLAAAFRLVARLGLHEAVANHFSAAVSADGRKFLMNPKWRHFSRIRASDLLLLEVGDERAQARTDLDPTAWAIHGQLHARLTHARVVIHLHPPHSTAIACLKKPEIIPIDQNTARYYNRVAVDDGYSGMADEVSEGARLAAALGNKSRMLMGNHGVLVVADTVGEAFDDIYTLERACQILTIARSTGCELNVLAPEVAERTAQDWEGIKDFSQTHFDEMKLILDHEDPSYAD